MDAGALSALIGISRAAFAKRPVEEMLPAVAAQTAALVEADRVAIMLAGAHEIPMVSACPGGRGRQVWDIGPDVAEQLRDRLGPGPRTIVPDVAVDADRALWRTALGPQPSAVIAIPFADASAPVAGALVAGGAWTPPRAQGLATLLEVVAMQIQLAIRTARLAEAHQDQMVALARMVVGLREQSQEHVSELLELEQALGDGSPAQHTASLVARYHTPGSAGRGRVENPIVAGLLLGEMSVARTRGIALRLTARSSLDAIPVSVGDLGFVSVISNLISNAFDAVETVPPKRRRVSLHLQQRAASTAIDVRDWGVGLGDHTERDVVRGGYSSKGAGRGTGLALVNRLVAAAGGTMKIERCPVGTRVKVTVPNA